MRTTVRYFGSRVHFWRLGAWSWQRDWKWSLAVHQPAYRRRPAGCVQLGWLRVWF